MTDNPQTTRAYYRTAHGSRVEISGRHMGIVTIDFDWLEEGACIESKRNVLAETRDPEDAWLFWSCKCCGGGQTRLQVTGAGKCPIL